MKYRYIYHDKIGRFYLRARPQTSLGSTLHNVLRAFHEAGGAQTPSEMVAQMEQKWVSAGYTDEAEESTFRAAGESMVTAYHAAFEERAVREVETILAERQIKTDMGAFWLAGRIDRVDRHPDGSLEVIDYKSGRWEVTPEEVASDLAMNAYQYILRSMYPDTRVFATVYCLRSGIQASAALTPEDAERFGIDMRYLGEEIISRDYENVEPVKLELCPDCEFLSRCERFWRRSEWPV